MEKQKVSYYELEGTYREIGRQIAGQEDTGKWYVPAPEYFTREALEEALGLYDMYCPASGRNWRDFRKRPAFRLRTLPIPG